MPKKLTAQQQVFEEAYRETNNAATAYRRAGYVQDRQGVTKLWLQQRASQVLNTPSMQQALTTAEKRREAKAEITLEWIRDHHIKLMDDSLLVGDRATATRNLEDLGKMEGAYTDNLNISAGQRKEYDEIEAEQALELSGLLMQKQLPVLDIGVEEVTNAGQEEEKPPKGAVAAEE